MYKYNGVEVKIGNDTYCAAPLNLRSLKELMPKIGQLGDAATKAEDQMDSMVEVIFHSLRRNHPDLTTEKLLDELTVVDMREVSQKVLEASGLGKVTAATATETSNGDGSTGS